LQSVTDRSACVAAPHRTSHPPQQKDAVHRCAPARGRWPAPAQDRCAAPHGRMRATPVIRPRRPPPRHRIPTRHVPRQQQQVLRKGGHPVVTFFEGLLIRQAHPSLYSLWYFLVHTLYTLGTLFLSVFVIQVFDVFAYLHCAHFQSRNSLLVYLGGSYRESLGHLFSLYDDRPFIIIKGRSS